MEATQASAPEQSQAQEPVHPIHQETALHERFTKIVQNSTDNDPHEGTDLEAPKSEKPKEDAAETPLEDGEQVEIDEDTPVFDIEYKTEKGEKEAKKLSLKELREGYLAKADYHRNIQRVKAQEAQLQQTIQQSQLQAMSHFAQQLETYKQALVKTAAPELLNVDLNKLAQEDPAEAQRIFFKQIELTKTLQGIEAEQQKAQQAYQQQQQAAFQQAVMESKAALQRDVEGWSDDLYGKVLKAMSEDYGMDPQGVANVVDAGVIRAFHDAYQYRQLKKAKPEISKKVVAVPKVVKPGSVEKPNPAREAANDLRQQLRKSGDWRDAAKWYLAQQKQQRK